MQCKSCFFIGHREAGPEILPAHWKMLLNNISRNMASRNSLLVITAALIV